MKIPFRNTFYKEGFKLALDNAKALQKISENSANENEYGIACSLNILAAEEAIKAIVILTRHYKPEMESSEFQKTFTNHKDKHRLIQLITFLSNYLVNEICSKYEENKYYFDAIDDFPEEEKIRLNKKYKHFYKIIEWAKTEKPKKDNFDEAMKWWNQANLQKNRGFYVDIQNKKWHNPRIYSKKQFEIEREYTISIIENIESFIDLFSPLKLLKQLKNIS